MFSPQFNQFHQQTNSFFHLDVALNLNAALLPIQKQKRTRRCSEVNRDITLIACCLRDLSKTVTS